MLNITLLKRVNKFVNINNIKHRQWKWKWVYLWKLVVSDCLINAVTAGIIINVSGVDRLQTSHDIEPMMLTRHASPRSVQGYLQFCMLVLSRQPILGGGALAVLSLIFANAPCQKKCLAQSSAENRLAFATTGGDIGAMQEIPRFNYYPAYPAKLVCASCDWSLRAAEFRIGNRKKHTEYRGISKYDTDTEVGIPIPKNIEYRRKDTEKTINRYFNFVITAFLVSYASSMATKPAKLNHFLFHDPSIQ